MPGSNRAHPYLRGDPHRDVIEAMTSGVAGFKSVRDPDSGRIVDFEWTLSNAYAEKIIGRPEAELLGKRMLDVLPEHGPSGLFERYAAVVESGEPIEFTAPYRDGDVDGVFSVRASKLGDGVAIAFIDVTEEVLRRREFETLANRLSLATRSAGIGVWERDLDTGELRLDGPARDIYGFSPDEAISVEKWRRRIHPEDVSALDAFMLAVSQTPDDEASPRGVRFRIVRRGGEVRHVQAYAQLAASSGSRRLVGVNWDVTGEVAAARELETKRRDAEAANIAKSQFLTVMSHETRTPLNGVLGMAAVLGQTKLTDAQRQMLRSIEESGEELLEILNGILELSRIEAGKAEIEEAAFNLDNLLRRVATLFHPAAADKGLYLRTEASKRAHGQFFTDPTRLRQILLNLVSNAVKFTSRGGVVVEADVEDRSSEDERVDLVLKVRDTGVGVPEDKLEAIFEPFTQADGSRTRAFGGAGLGLSVARQLARVLGGDVTVTSEPGRGSTFTARIPASRGETSHAPAPPAAATTLHCALGAKGRVRILAAEDHPTNQIILREMLKDGAVELTMVENGRQAIEAWAANDFDLLILDIQMPVMDGLAAAREIRRLEREMSRPRTPILSVSANALPFQVRNYLAAGIDSHVAKPVFRPALLEAVGDLLASEAQASARAAS